MHQGTFMFRICVHINTYICIYNWTIDRHKDRRAYAHAYRQTHTHRHRQICMYVCLSLCCMHAGMGKCACVYVCAKGQMHTHVCAYQFSHGLDRQGPQPAHIVTE